MTRPFFCDKIALSSALVCAAVTVNLSLHLCNGCVLAGVARGAQLKHGVEHSVECLCATLVDDESKQMGRHRGEECMRGRRRTTYHRSALHTTGHLLWSGELIRAGTSDIMRATNDQATE